jgi:predicted SAM-dependent methyltransferase
MIACPICSAPSDPSIWATDENHRCSSAVFAYARCRPCGTIVLAKPPTDLGRYYEAGYYEIPSIEQVAAISRKDRNKIDIVNRFASGSRLLEIGPAFGVFAFGAKQAGYDVEVVEMDERCCAFLRDEVRVPVTRSATPHDAMREQPRHDVIALWHVLEHLPDVPSMISASAENLVSGGILVIAVPNPEAAQFQLMGSHWPHLDAPRHLSLLPARTLAGLARRQGLEVVFQTSDDPDGRRWNRFGWQRLFMNRFRSRLVQRVMFVLGYAIAVLMSPFDRRPMLGSAYTMVLTKVAA